MPAAAATSPRRPVPQPALQPTPPPAEPVITSAAPVLDLSAHITSRLADLEAMTDWRSWTAQHPGRIRAVTTRLLGAVLDQLRLHAPGPGSWCVPCLPGQPGTPARLASCGTAHALLAHLPFGTSPEGTGRHQVALDWAVETLAQLSRPEAGEREIVLAHGLLPALLTGLRALTGLHETTHGWCSRCLETPEPGQPVQLGCTTVRRLHAHIFAPHPPAPLPTPPQRPTRSTPGRSPTRGRWRGTRRPRTGQAP